MATIFPLVAPLPPQLSSDNCKWGEKGSSDHEASYTSPRFKAGKKTDLDNRGMVAILEIWWWRLTSKGRKKFATLSIFSSQWPWITQSRSFSWTATWQIHHNTMSPIWAHSWAEHSMTTRSPGINMQIILQGLFYSISPPCLVKVCVDQLWSTDVS